MVESWEARVLGSHLSFTSVSLALSKSLVLSGPQFPFLHPLPLSQQMSLSSLPELAFTFSELLPPLEVPFPLLACQAHAKALFSCYLLWEACQGCPVTPS